jgi:50S ribosomal subunit-associated GTPase HflX
MDIKPTLLIFNKIDRVEQPGILERARRIHPGAAFTAAAKGLGLDALLARLLELAEGEEVERRIRLRTEDAEAVSRVYTNSQVLDAQYHDGYVDLTFRASRAWANALGRMAAPDDRTEAEAPGDESE